jgi:hypothetical protein
VKPPPHGFEEINPQGKVQSNWQNPASSTAGAQAVVKLMAALQPASRDSVAA